jgi:phosphatidylglycerophosphatase A
MIDAAKNRHRAPIQPFDAPTAWLTTLGLGFVRPAPGTWGSLPPPVVGAILLLAGASAWTIAAVASVFLLAGSAACVAFGPYAERRFGRKDAAEVVADETAGAAIPLLLVPTIPAEWLARCVWPRGAESSAADVFSALAATGIVTGGAFLLFRVFDITKLWPSNYLERAPSGWGVLLDDLMAGAYAAVVVWLLLFFVPPPF